MNNKGFSDVIFYATKHGENEYVEFQGSGADGSNSIMREEDRILICGNKLNRKKVRNSQGQGITVLEEEQLVEIDPGLFDRTIKARIKEMFKEANITKVPASIAEVLGITSSSDFGFTIVEAE